ncbi:16S rRNA (cytidine(1402)-2'-O)-methyltransferase [Sporolactobacillus shoreicorticis]|uniref:Ribosomal RNA small subunit methyltransferase I n=1 Tax=Sporolactobacillus shoreicorticis TaxID=1923877 RepID=A0ABW5S848_9BACL|nr:16S rRNA (cytidine(1402)-2'-O)-methyltransferase [Sporolactobacillus shoreicorticis]MCO7127716.1 16S rRNA (cytidine(1402)-2'-O)-methyltransferase [Sporolactobacillus shoreicorticis]
MWEQRSFQGDHEGKGSLFLVPTPIGNLDDITYRALNVLKNVDVLAAEDTRHTMKLCSHFDIHAPLFSYHEHNKKTSGAKLIAELEGGKNVALVTDAGTPGISDPGADLAAACIAHEIPVVPLPGANAAISGLIASGLSTDHFLFYGFLSRVKKERSQALQALGTFPYTIIFYESPFRVKDTLKDLLGTLGNRHIALSRELTKRYETIVRGTISDVLDFLSNGEVPRGEFCLIVEGSSESEAHEQTLWWSSLAVQEHVDHYICEKQLSVKEAIKQVALDRAQPKRDIYRIYHQIEK